MHEIDPAADNGGMPAWPCLCFYEDTGDLPAAGQNVVGPFQLNRYCDTGLNNGIANRQSRDERQARETLRLRIRRPYEAGIQIARPGNPVASQPAFAAGLLASSDPGRLQFTSRHSRMRFIIGGPDTVVPDNLGQPAGIRAHRNSDAAAALAAMLSCLRTRTMPTAITPAATAMTLISIGAESNSSAGSSKYMILTTRR